MDWLDDKVHANYTKQDEFFIIHIVYLDKCKATEKIVQRVYTIMQVCMYNAVGTYLDQVVLVLLRGERREEVRDAEIKNSAPTKH